MNPEQSMRIYLAECEIHAEVLNQGLVDIQKYRNTCLYPPRLR